MPLFFVAPDGHNHILTLCMAAIYLFAAIQSISNALKFPKFTSFFNGEFLFLAYAYIAFYSPYLNDVLTEFRIEDQSKFRINYWEASNKAVIASTIAVISFSMGARIAQRLFARRRSVRPIVRDANSMFPWFVIGMWLVAFSIFFAVGGSVFFSAVYDRQAQADSGVFQFYVIANFAAVLAASSFAYHVAKRRRMNMGIWLLGGIGGVWLALTFAIGDRGSMFMLVIAVCAIVFAFTWRFNLLLAITLGVSVVMVSGTIEAMRASGDRGLQDFVRVLTSPEERRNIEESGISTTTAVTRAIIYSVPEDNEYFQGKITFNALLTPIPFVRGLLRDPTDPFPRSSDLATKLLVRRLDTYGTGTSIVADAYVDFGIWHVVLVLMVFGFAARYFAERASKNPDSHDAVVMFAIATALFALVIRYGMAWPVRDLVWALLLMVGSDWASRMLRRRARR